MSLASSVSWSDVRPLRRRYATTLRTVTFRQRSRRYHNNSPLGIRFLSHGNMFIEYMFTISCWQTHFLVSFILEKVFSDRLSYHLVHPFIFVVYSIYWNFYCPCGASFFSGSASWINVIASPFNKIRPTSTRPFLPLPISTASSKTIFMYSSKPIIWPSICVFVSSYSQIRTLVFFYVVVHHQPTQKGNRIELHRTNFKWQRHGKTKEIGQQRKRRKFVEVQTYLCIELPTDTCDHTSLKIQVSVYFFVQSNNIQSWVCFSLRCDVASSTLHCLLSSVIIRSFVLVSRNRQICFYKESQHATSHSVLSIHNLVYSSSSLSNIFTLFCSLATFDAHPPTTTKSEQSIAKMMRKQHDTTRQDEEKLLSTHSRWNSVRRDVPAGEKIWR